MLTIAEIRIEVPNSFNQVSYVTISHSGLEQLRKQIAANTFNKVAWIKAVREKYSFGLKEAKDLVDTWQEMVVGGQKPAQPISEQAIVDTHTWT